MCSVPAPNSEDARYIQLINSCNAIVEKCSDNDHVFLLGDFNKPTEWVSDTENPVELRPTTDSSQDNDFFDALASLSPSQVCNIRTRNQLDLIFSDVDSDILVHDSSHPLKQNSHHRASIELMFVLRSFITDDVEDHVPSGFDYRKADVAGLSSAMGGIDWEAVLSGSNIDAKVEQFYTELHSLFDRFVPVRTQRRQFTQPWMTALLARLRNRRNRAFKSWKRTGSVETYFRFLVLRDEFVQKNAMAYERYLDKQADRLKSASKDFWKMINSKRGTSGLPRRMTYAEKESTSSR